MAAVLEREGFSDRLAGYAVMVANKIEENYKKYPNLKLPKVGYVIGGKYVKVYVDDGVFRSIHSFIDRSNGDILKAASWRAPAKHARGNIYAADFGKSAINAYGANYL